MTPVDIAIVIAFFLGIFAIGLYERKKIAVDDYWVNSRRTNKFVLVATTTSTFLGVGSLVSFSVFLAFDRMSEGRKGPPEL